VGGEVPATGHGGVAGEVVGPLDPTARQPAPEVGGEDRDRGRHIDALDKRAELVVTLEVGTERRRDRVGEPVQRRLRQQEVVVEPGGDVAAAIAPRNILEVTYPTLAIVLAMCGTDRVDVTDRELVDDLRKIKRFNNVLMVILRRGSDVSKFKENRDDSINSGVGKEKALFQFIWNNKVIIVLHLISAPLAIHRANTLAI